MSEVLKILGLDFGTTTSSAVAASVKIAQHPTTGQRTFEHMEILFQSDPIFTPYLENSLDEAKLRTTLDLWLLKSKLAPKEIFSGGAIITGLAAKKTNATQIAQMISEKMENTLLVTAEDSLLESWLAFMGNCFSLSKSLPKTPILNLDIGGGTTNAALGLNGNTISLGAYFLGARHFEFTPGTYKIIRISEYGKILLDYLGFEKSTGEDLKNEEQAALLNLMIQALEAIVQGNQLFFQGKLSSLENEALSLPFPSIPFLTFSGGVGELVYATALGEPLPETTFFGDLGLDLARAIVASPLLSKDLHRAEPLQKRGATLFGLALHSAELSGSSLFLKDPLLLPLKNIPIVHRLSLDATMEELACALSLAQRSPSGACIQVTSLDKVSRMHIETFSEQLRSLLSKQACFFTSPLLLLTSQNIGKTLGNYVTNWGKFAIKLVVIDEISQRNAHFVNVGTLHHEMVPVSFYGMFERSA